LHDKTQQNDNLLGRGNILKTNNSGQKQQLWVHKNSPCTKNTTNLEIAMNSQIGQSNDKWRDIEKPKSYKEKQTNEHIKPIAPFNFEEGIHEMKELQHLHKDDNQQKELWRWHLKLNHLSFTKIIFMLLQGKSPKLLNATDIPFCPTCAYSTAARKPSRNKNGNNKLKETTKPGQCVSVDTFESSTTGFIAQIKGMQIIKGTEAPPFSLITLVTYHLCSSRIQFKCRVNQSESCIRTVCEFMWCERVALPCG